MSVVAAQSTPALVPTVDTQDKVQVKTTSGTYNLPKAQSHAEIPTREDYRIFNANTLGSWGTYTEFQLTNLGVDIVDKMTVVVAMGAGSKTGGTYINLVNHGINLFKQIEVRVGSTLIETLYPLKGYVEDVANLATVDKVKLLQAAGDDTLANRKTNTAAGQTLYIPIRIPFFLKHGFNAAQIGNQIFDIKLYHDSITNVVDTDGTSPSIAINSVQLIVEGKSFINPNSVQALKAQHAKLGKFDTHYLSPIQQQTSLSSGATNYTVNLTNIVGAISHLWFTVRLQSNVNTALGNSPDSFITISSFDLKDAAGNYLVQTTPSGYALSTLADKYWSGTLTDYNSSGGLDVNPQLPLYFATFNSQPEMSMKVGSAHGFYRFTGLERLDITLTSSASASMVVDVLAYTYANIAFDSNGVAQKTLL